ncbi:MAG: hypothetical protein H0X66_17010 [Verrucomicrobia bacterium]|nr:hypothetical protein [Verrucomicrobiota bacterium]
MSRRFTIDGSTELEQHLDCVCKEVRERVCALVPFKKLEAIFLGGGYGRGEGGVLRTPAGDRPYNDLEFYICVTGNPRLNERSFGEQLHELGEELSEHAGVEVEFKITSTAKLRNSAPSMFHYDLAMGHRTLVGSDDTLRAERFQDSTEIPLHEATRLLMNRCTGLLLSEEKLLHTPFTAEDADFVERNHAKAQLAFGDVVLTVLGQYHWSCRERNRRLQKIADESPLADIPVCLEKIFCHHTLAVEFKLHPRQTNRSVEKLLPLQAEVGDLGRNLWLWLESRRLNKHFSSVQDYALSSTDKCPETNPLKNRLINLRHFGLPGFLGRRGGRYPRERLLHALALLLWDPAGRQTISELGKIQEALNTDSTDFDLLLQAYCNLWKKFN